MDSLSPKSKDGAQEQYAMPDLTVGSHWASGMPLSWVHETVTACLGCSGEVAPEPDSTGHAE